MPNQRNEIKQMILFETKKGYERGLDIGLKEGIQKGIEIGLTETLNQIVAETKREIILSMLKNHLGYFKIAKYLNMNYEEIVEIKENYFC